MATVTPVMAGRALEYWLRSYRGTWRASVFSGFLSPLLYLASLGFGLGALIDRGPSGGVAGLPYAQYVAPGVLAVTAMQTAVGESTYTVMTAVRWQRFYFAMLATPLRVIDVVLGHLGFIVFRLLLVTVTFAGVGAVLGAFTSGWVLAAVPVAVLVGLAHATPVMAFSVGRETDVGFGLLFRLVIVPMSLFAGTFFPVDQLPPGLRPLAWAAPLWHGTEAARALATGRFGLWPVTGHLAYLLVWTLGGLAAAVVCYRRTLVR
ncbi:MAG: lipooligosaccharide transport system permease protein [Actinomycetota bacterium]|nr:lipooligosaccharide transport system permease protein [Actinomycetota bacterium]